MEVKVKVIYPQDKVLEFEADHGDNIFQLLEECWSFLNRKDVPNYFLDINKARSSQIGDIYQVTRDGTTRYFICDSVGFSEIDKAYTDDWLKLNHMQRMFGTVWAERKGFIEKNCLFFYSPEDLTGIPEVKEKL